MPGHTLEGFQLTSYGLPGIWEVEVRPWIDPDQVPENLTSWDELNNFYSQFVFRSKSVGPTAPPQDFVAVDFLNYLITLVHDSRQLGWVREAEEQTHLVRMLLKAKRHLEAGGPGKARSALKAFLQRVREAGCRGFDCPKDKALTSEAYALLLFNGQFLHDRL